METFKAVFLRRSLSFLWYLQSFSLTRRNLYQFLFISFQILLHPSNRFCTNHFVFCTNSQKVCTNLQQDFTSFSTKGQQKHRTDAGIFLPNIPCFCLTTRQTYSKSCKSFIPCSISSTERLSM